MLSSRAHRRITTLVAVVPLIVGAGPFVAPAFAVNAVRQAALATTQGVYKIGPNAGFGGNPDRGISGRTAIVAISAAPSDTLTSVKVTVAESGPFAYGNDFDAVDGFALYKDLNDNDRLDQADFDAGMVSQGQPNVSVVNGNVTVTVAADPAKATGQDNYLLTTHPLATAAGERKVFFTIPVNGVLTSAGSQPAGVLTLSDIWLDAQAPAQLGLNQFTQVSRIPTDNCPTPAPAIGCGNDAYDVYRLDAYDVGDKIGFYNSGTDVTDAAQLRVPSGNSTAPAVYDLQSISSNVNSKTRLSIGNGTGRDASVAGSKALNNQISDDVWAVQWDPIGNLTSLRLTNAPACDTTTNPCGQPLPFVPRGNDVTAPALTYTVTMDPVNAASNPSSIKVHTVLGGTDTQRPAFTSQTPVSTLVLPQHLEQVPGSNPVAYRPIAGHENDGAEVRSTSPPTVVPAANAQLDAFVNVSNNTLFPQGDFVWSTVRVADDTGNTTTSKATAAVLKDTVAPNFVRISLLDLNNNGVSEAGEKFRVEFDDTMDTADITPANLASKLILSEASAGQCGSPVPMACPPDWGQDATAVWSADAHLLTITLGTPCSALSTECTSLTRLPHAGDRVTAAAGASGVTDRNQNNVANGTNFVIGSPIVLPVEARTVDTAGAGSLVWNTNRDGVLDAIDVEFSGNLDSDSVSDANAAHLFEVSWQGTPIVPTASLSSPDTIHLAFTVPSNLRSAWGTGATPKMSLKANDQGSTLVETTGNQAIPAFDLTAVDRVAPVPLSVKTADSTGDGKIDKVTIKLSEGILTDAENKPNECGWRVAGYTDSNYKPVHGVLPAAVCPNSAGGSPVPSAPANGPTYGPTNDTVTLALAVGASVDTVATPLVWFSATAGQSSYPPGTESPACANIGPTGTPGAVNCPINDLAGNDLASFFDLAADGAGPAIISRVTEDTNSDGRIDRLRATFSETISTPSVGTAQFEVSVPTYTIESLSAPTSNSVAVNVVNVAPRTGDTGITPKLKFLGGTTDIASPPNTSPVDTDGVVAKDTAGPAILGACASSPAGTNGLCPADDAATDKITLLMSENLNASTNTIVKEDFVVEQPLGTAKTQTADPVLDADLKRVTLTFAQGAIDSNAAGVVRFSGTAKVNDGATTGQNGNTQTDNVPLFPSPTVTLSLTCPVAASPGYCGANFVNTGAGGSPGVSQWRLSTTARGTTPPDSEFSATLPTTYPPSGTVLPEGVLKLYLSGKDPFGRLSPEVSSTINILKSPKINNVQLVNATPARFGSWPKMGGTLGQTVLDGDSVQIAGDAQGTDAAQWATKTTGGGCLAQYMSVNMIQLTGSANTGTVPPVACDLKTSTTPPFRQMQFPSVKVGKTTKYPVGTVLRSSGSGINYLIADGPNGTVQRRRFISIGARRSWLIPDALVITVPTPALGGIPQGPNVGYRDGSFVRASGTGYYYINQGVRRPVTSSTMAYWRIPGSAVYTIPLADLTAMPAAPGVGQGAHPVGVWVKFANGTIQQIARNGAGQVVRRNVASASARNTLVPATHIVPANSKDAALPLDTWVRGYRDGILVKVGANYGVISRSSLRMFANPRTFNSLGYVTSNAITFNAANMPHVAAQGYRTGVAIDRYKITSIVIKVTNKAGAITTAIVTPAEGGIYGVGTLDPAPGGWDFTRN